MGQKMTHMGRKGSLGRRVLNRRKTIEILDTDDEGGNQSWLQQILSEAEGLSTNNLDEFGLDMRMLSSKLMLNK